MKKFGIVLLIIFGIWIIGAVGQSIEHKKNPYGWSEPSIKLVERIKSAGFEIVEVPSANSFHASRVKLIIKEKKGSKDYEMGFEHYEKLPEDVKYHKDDWEMIIIDNHYLVWLSDPDQYTGQSLAEAKKILIRLSKM